MANAQNNINVVFNETQLNNAIKVITDARAINFGDYLDQYGINAWFLNLDNATVDIQPNNVVVLKNIKMAGGVDLDLWMVKMTPTGVITGSITGQFRVEGSPSEGYVLLIKPTAVDLSYTGALQTVLTIIALLGANLSIHIPDIEINLGSSILPDIVLKYFKSGIPQITTNNSEIILSFEVLFDNIKIKNKIIHSGDVVNYKASNSITFEPGFTVQNGATLSVSITPKGRGDLDSIALVNNQHLYTSNNTTVNSEATLINGNKSTVVDFLITEEPLDYVSVYPNPFMNTLKINATDNPADLFSVTIFDIQGRIVYERKNINVSEVDLSGLDDGMYVLRFSSENINKSKKIIKTK